MVEYKESQAHYIAVTGIIVDKDKYLITKRSETEKNFPGLWTVPGGKLEKEDYTQRKKDTSVHWYNVFEEVLRREIKEEVNLEVQDFGYVTSIVFIRSDKVPAVIVSFYTKYLGGEIKLCDALTEYKWVTLQEAKEYELIEGIYDELVMLDKHLKGEKIGTWGK